MRVVLFRHGPAGSRDPSRWPDDGDRPLSSRGEERTRAAAHGLRRLLEGRRPVVVTSPLVRSKQTARIVADVLGAARVVEQETLAPGVTPARALRALAALDGEEVVVAVGHEPDLGRLAGLMAFGGASGPPLKKAGACAIDFEDSMGASRGEMRWLLTPRILRRLGGRKHA